MHYAPIIFSLDWFSILYRSLFESLKNEYRLQDEDEWKLYDWLVTQALGEALGVVVENNTGLVPIDIYSIIYRSDEVHELLLGEFTTLCQRNRLEWMRGSAVKIMVLGSILILARREDEL